MKDPESRWPAWPQINMSSPFYIRSTPITQGSSNPGSVHLGFQVPAKSILGHCIVFRSKVSIEFGNRTKCQHPSKFTPLGEANKRTMRCQLRSTHHSNTWQYIIGFGTAETNNNLSKYPARASLGKIYNHDRALAYRKGIIQQILLYTEYRGALVLRLLLVGWGVAHLHRPKNVKWASTGQWATPEIPIG